MTSTAWQRTALPRALHVAAGAIKSHKCKKGVGVDDNAAAHDAEGLGPEDTRRNLVQTEVALVVDDRMPGVVAASEARDDVGVFRQKINDLPFTFITPLSAQNRVCRHTPSPRKLHAVIAHANFSGPQIASRSERAGVANGRLPCESIGIAWRSIPDDSARWKQPGVRTTDYA